MNIMEHWEKHYTLENILSEVKKTIGVDEWLNISSKEECEGIVPLLEELDEYEIIIKIKKL